MVGRSHSEDFLLPCKENRRDCSQDRSESRWEFVVTKMIHFDVPISPLELGDFVRVSQYPGTFHFRYDGAFPCDIESSIIQSH